MYSKHISIAIALVVLAIPATIGLRLAGYLTPCEAFGSAVPGCPPLPHELEDDDSDDTTTDTGGSGGSGGGFGGRRISGIVDGILATRSTGGMYAAPQIPACALLEWDPLTNETAATYLSVLLSDGGVTFSDVRTDTWYAHTIKIVAEFGIVHGYQYRDGRLMGLFGPKDSVTREQIAKMVVLAAGVPIPRDTSAAPRQDHWSTPYIAALLSTGSTAFAGLDGQEMKQPASRGEVAQVLLDAYGISPFRYNGSRFTDVSPSTTPYAAAIETAAELCIVEGDDGTSTYRPFSPINRAEVSAIVARALVNDGQIEQ